MNDTVEIGYFLLHGEEVIKIGFLNNGEFIVTLFIRLEQNNAVFGSWIVRRYGTKKTLHSIHQDIHVPL